MSAIEDIDIRSRDGRRQLVFAAGDLIASQAWVVLTWTSREGLLCAGKGKLIAVAERHLVFTTGTASDRPRSIPLSALLQLALVTEPAPVPRRASESGVRLARAPRAPLSKGAKLRAWARHRAALRAKP